MHWKLQSFSIKMILFCAFSPIVPIFTNIVQAICCMLYDRLFKKKIKFLFFCFLILTSQNILYHIIKYLFIVVLRLF